jgi:hypothetical protein
MTSTDLFRRRANEWRRLAARARNANDGAFWLGLAERREAARQRCLKQVLAGDLDRRKQKVIARPNNLIFGRAYETAVRLSPKDTIHYRDGARIIARSGSKA